MLPKTPSLDLRLSFIWEIYAYKMKINKDPKCQVFQLIFNEIELIWTEFALLTSAHCDYLVYIHMTKYKRRLISNYCFIVPRSKGLSYRTYYFEQSLYT